MTPIEISPIHPAIPNQTRGGGGGWEPANFASRAQGALKPFAGLGTLLDDHVVRKGLRFERTLSTAVGFSRTSPEASSRDGLRSLHQRSIPASSLDAFGRSFDETRFDQPERP